MGKVKVIEEMALAVRHVRDAGRGNLLSDHDVAALVLDMLEARGLKVVEVVR